ncbi:MAG: hypothetical protein V3U24_11445 [Candidatus Neomarinimicrobiota bacterium]
MTKQLELRLIRGAIHQSPVFGDPATVPLLLTMGQAKSVSVFDARLSLDELQYGFV